MSKVVSVVVESAPAVSAASAAPGLWAAYLSYLEREPLRTKAVTAGVLSAVSDLLAQRLSAPEASKARIDWSSVAKQVAVGLALRGPVGHYWFAFLDRAFARWDQAALSTAVAKVLVDQAVMSPLFNWLYFYVMGALDGRTLDQVAAKVRTDFRPLMIANYRVWPLVNLVNFKLVPPQLRVLFGNLVGVLWTAYAIALLSKKKK